MTTENGQAKSTICHTERSEVSKNPSTNTLNLLDISVASLPQYDNTIVITKETSASPCFASKSQDLRGNP